MVRAKPVWSGVLASYDLLSGNEVFCKPDAGGRVHGERNGNELAPSSGMTVTLSIDASELERDLERIENEELELPTVSAVKVSCDGVFEEQVTIWLPEQ
jgi:hypothetical protein